MRIAYLSNRFPSVVEPYVATEILEFERRGVEVIVCSVLRPTDASENSDSPGKRALYLWPVKLLLALQATWLTGRYLLERWKLVRGVIAKGDGPLRKRLRVLAHTWLGAYLAGVLRKQRVAHIHVHHGYFASWMAMVAAQILKIEFSMTLHGSDLLVHNNYLETKLLQCGFCVTVSEFNRRFIHAHYAHIPAEKILVQRVGVECGPRIVARRRKLGTAFRLLAVGRLHPVKDHAFLIRACEQLKDRGVPVACSIAGDGPERKALQRMIESNGLEFEVSLLGQVSHESVGHLYDQADLVVLTSTSEGIPLVLMEAMARGRPVLAPSITGIPELVVDGENGFLYPPGSLPAFVAKVEAIRNTYSTLGPLCDAAQQQVFENFNRTKNVTAFCDAFLAQLERSQEYSSEDSLLQQVQLSV